MGDYKETKEQLLREIDQLKAKIAKLEKSESERKRMEEALKESEEKFRTILENAPVFIDAFDKNGKCILWNNECEKTFGWTIEEINSVEDPLSLFYPDPEIREKVRKSISSEPDNKFREWRPLTKGGNQLVTLWASFKVSDGSVISLGYNITEQKQAEQIQKVLQNISNAVSTTDSLEKLISHIQKELGTIIDTTNFYVALYDHKTDTLSLPFFADEKNELTSLPAGKTLTKYVITTQKPLLATKERKKQLEESGDIEHFETDSEIWLGVPLKIKGEVTGVLAVQSYTNKSAYDESDMEMLESIARQISISINRKKTEQGLIKALEKATESDRLKSAFLATISHELRTPLNAIIGFSDIINEDLPIDDIIEFNKTINASGNHLLSIVKDLFDITLIESGEIKIVKEDFKLQTILNDVQNIIKAEQQKTNKGNIGLNMVIPPEGENLIINTDPSKLKQILINLLKNALKFTHEGPHEGHINYGYNIEVGHAKPVLKFYIEDTGIGIPKDKQGLIFDIFRQVEDSHTRIYGGTGIGLSISKKLAELLGGRIWLESEEGEGSTFYFEMPLDEFEGVSKPIIKKAGNNYSLKGKTILIVEDVKISFEF
ncbi:MAG: GAF domain-containing protein, partial [Chlorobi bacterium]|nr:GAF domain-containing protein [Chlorobiota bacterium]